MAGGGSTISVRVSGRQIEAIPDVEGKTIEEARQSIRGRPFSLEVKTVESSSREIGTVLRQDPKGGDGVTAEAGTHVTVTVGGGPSAAKVPDPREPFPKEADPMPGGQTGTPDDLVSTSRNRAATSHRSGGGGAGRFGGERRRIRTKPDTGFGRRGPQRREGCYTPLSCLLARTVGPVRSPVEYPVTGERPRRLLRGSVDCKAERRKPPQ